MNGRWPFFRTAALSVIVCVSATAEIPNKARASIDQIIGGRGTYVVDDGVYKITLPQTSATVVLDYQTLSPNMGLNSWAGFSPAVDQEALLTGQLLLLEDEVDPVLTALLPTRLRITGLADTTAFQGPRLKCLDVVGTGTYEDLATAFRKALDAVRQARIEAGGRAKGSLLPTLSLDSSIDPSPLNALLSMKGTVSDGVYRATIGRHAKLQGQNADQEMSFETWISFVGTNERATSHGEFAANATDLQHLLKALRSRNFHVLSIRNHTDGEHPQILFVQFWHQGKADTMAKDLRYVLDGGIRTSSAQSLPRKDQ